MNFVAPWKPIAEAPTDGTLLLLLVDYRDEQIGRALEDELFGRTIGFNNLDNDGEDAWKFAGWCWEHDHFVEGKGKPVAFASLTESPKLTDEPDEDEGGDPTTSEPLKPRGNGGIASAEICFCTLMLVGDTDVTEAQCAAWTQEQRDVAYDWAIRVHLHASDNDDVLVPARPEFVPHKAAGYGGGQ